MKRLAVVLAIILSPIFLFSLLQQAQATTLDYFQVQHRNFADGSGINRVQFGGNPEEGPPFDLTTLYIKLNGSTVQNGNTPVTFNPTYYNFVSGVYAGNNSWSFSSVQPQVNYAANVNSALPTGTYEMGINGFNSRFTIYTGAVTLPIVDSKTFLTGFDANGNLHFSWTTPPNISDTQFVYADILGYIGGQFFSELLVQNPYYINSLIVPDSILDSLGNVDFLRLSVQVRSADQSNRGISNSIDIIRPVPEAATVLLLGAGLIGLAGYGRKKLIK